MYDGVAAAQNGLDLEMPFARYFSRETLVPAVHSGAVTQETIDDKVRRILRFIYRFGINGRQQDSQEPLFSQQNDRLALEIARRSITLLKNDGHVLPLDPAKTCTLAIIGPNASPAVMGGGGSAIVDTYQSVGLLVGLSDFMAIHTSPQPSCARRVLYDAGWPSIAMCSRRPHSPAACGNGSSHRATGLALRRRSPRAPEQTASSHRQLDLSGGQAASSPQSRANTTSSFTMAARQIITRCLSTANHSRHMRRICTVNFATFQFQPLRAGESIDVRFDYLPADSQVYPGLGVLQEDDVLSSRAKAIAKAADAVVIAVGFDKSTEHEGMDRTFELPPLQDVMIRNISGTNRRSIVTLNAGGNVDMGTWIDSVPALLHLWYPGQEGGTALADVLFGEQNPEGHLPVSFEQRWEDNPTFHSYYPQDTSEGKTPHIHYNEGVFLGYRFYSTPAVNTAHIVPRFPFGFGLSYTTFRFSGLKLSRSTASAGDPVTASFTVTNTGAVAGATVAQLYVGEPSPSLPRPAYELKGFARVSLKAGESRSIQLPLDRRSFAFWSTVEHGWKVDPGRYTIYVGDSSAELPLHQDLTLR